MARASNDKLSRESEQEAILKHGGLLGADGMMPDEEPLDAEDNEPAYRLIGKASVPVSKKAGSRWEAKAKNALDAYDFARQAWNKAYTSYRACSGDGITNPTDDGRTYFANDTDENLTRENVKTLLRTAYTSNPKVELSSVDGDDEAAGEMYGKIVNQLLNRPAYPGINAKSRIRRWIMHGHLTNFGILRLDYQAMTGSRQEGQTELLRLQEDVAKEKDTAKLEELYAELEQVEENLSTTRDAGMILNNVNGPQLLLDPDTTYLDLTDCKWLMEYVWLGNAYLKKRYLRNQDGRWVRISDGKDANGLNGDASQSGNNLAESIVDSILGVTPESVVTARTKDKTKCVMIWDKLTKQISLWIDGQWDYPLYVWEDDLKLSRFYPYFLIAFSEPLDTVVQEGEQAQYAGQEKEINKINKRVAFIRRVAFGTLIFNSKKIDSEEVAKVIAHLKNPEEFDAIGMSWDPALKISDMFDFFMPKDTEVQALYDKSDLTRVVDRVNSQSDVSKGGQFKTNTTNKAVAAYQNVQATVSNELTDAIEDALYPLVWAMMEIIASKYTQEQIEALIGIKNAEGFETMSVEEFNQAFSMEIAAGSTEKPTSANKKNEAMQIAQAIGQVGQAAPFSSMRVIFRMFGKAFSDFFQFTKDDEQSMLTEATANLQKGVSTPSGQPGGSPGGAPPAGPVATGPVASPAGKAV